MSCFSDRIEVVIGNTHCNLFLVWAETDCLPHIVPLLVHSLSIYHHHCHILCIQSGNRPTNWMIKIRQVYTSESTNLMLSFFWHFRDTLHFFSKTHLLDLVPSVSKWHKWFTFWHFLSWFLLWIHLKYKDSRV